MTFSVGRRPRDDNKNDRQLGSRQNIPCVSFHGLVGVYLDIWQCPMNDNYPLGLGPRVVGRLNREPIFDIENKSAPHGRKQKKDSDVVHHCFDTYLSK